MSWLPTCRPEVAVCSPLHTCPAAHTPRGTRVHQRTCPVAHVPSGHAVHQRTCSGHPWPPGPGTQEIQAPCQCLCPRVSFLLLLGGLLLIDSLSMNLDEENLFVIMGDLIKMSQVMQFICSFCFAFEIHVTVALGTEETSSSHLASGIELKLLF